MTNSNLGLYKKGTYVKIVIKDFSSSIKDDYPMILARSEVGEDNLGFIKVLFFIYFRYELKNIDGIVIFWNPMILSLSLLDGEDFKQYLFIAYKILMIDYGSSNTLQNMIIVMLYFMAILHLKEQVLFVLNH